MHFAPGRSDVWLEGPSVGRKAGSTKLTAAPRRAVTPAVLFLLLLGAVGPTHGQTETVLYSFAGDPDGANPDYVTPALKKAGNLYGTTPNGGAYGYGTVFEVTPSGLEAILYSLNPGNGTDGNGPAAGVVRDAKGNLYGTTEFGGVYSYGTVFEVTPLGTETILHSFGASGDGSFPFAGLVLDKKGNLYGTTDFGGAHGNGTVFKLTRSGTETILHSFGSGNRDGCNPYSRVILDEKGNLYGTTLNCGAYDGGTVFKLTPSGRKTILWSFGKGTDGNTPIGDLVFDKEGNLYGTTEYGGAYTVGTVFEVTPSGTETILHSFNHNGSDGNTPYAGLVFDEEGNLYGTTRYGGAYNAGTVFELTPSGAETILWSFGNGTDGQYPWGGLALDKKGSLYGTTQAGGTYNYGTVYKVTP
jgi:uncharacterized repeat protein (TIGR03803 family)